MSEIRFTIQKASGMYLHLPIFDNGVEMADGDVCILLNEQQATIQSLKEENEELKRKLEYCEHEHFLDSLGSSNKWFGMGGF